MKNLVAGLPILAAAAIAHAGAYDARRTEMTNWVEAAQFGDPSKKDPVKGAMSSYCSAIDGALDALARTLDPGSSDYASKWSAGLQRAKDAFLTFQSSLQGAAGGETNEKVKTDLLRIVAEEQVFINSLGGTEQAGKGADQLVAVKKDIDDTKDKVVVRKFQQFATDATERNRYAADAFNRIRSGAEANKSAMARAKADSRNAILAGVAGVREFLGKKLDELTLIKSQFKTWEEQINTLRRTHNESIVAIARAMCNGEDWEAEALGQAAADSIRRQVQPEYSQLKQTGEDLISRLGSLTSVNTQAEAAALSAEISKKLNSLRLTESSGILSGSVNPNIRTKASYGTAQHNSMQGSYGCSAANLPIANCSRPKVTKGCFADCVRVSGSGPAAACEIVEFKPEGTRAVELGTEQMWDYRNSVMSKFSSASPQSTNDAFFSGDYAVFKPCFDPSSKTLLLGARLVTYPFCPINPEAIATILSW